MGTINTWIIISEGMSGARAKQPIIFDLHPIPAACKKVKLGRRLQNVYILLKIGR